MNEKLLRILRNKMLECASLVNKLVTQYESMKASGASISELNEIATKAHDYNSKYSTIKSEYEGYVSRYERYVSLKKIGGREFEEARTRFLTFELSLSFKYEVDDVIEKAREERKNEEVIPSYSSQSSEEDDIGMGSR